MATSTSSRNIAALSPIHRLGKPGLGLVTWVDSPTDRRVKLLKLTEKGRDFSEQILGLL
jgi:DNA-binding MarR family transcriptional regulator